jgi:sortase (surface protein transpeptidase)
MRRGFRVAGLVLVTAGVLALAWVVLVWRWQDPFTALYTHEQQSRLARSFAEEYRAFRPPASQRASAVSAAAEARAVAREAAAFRRRATTGQAIGRLIVPRLGLNMVLVNGTDSGSLEKGPGRDRRRTCPAKGGSSTSPGTGRRTSRRSRTSRRCAAATGSRS